MYLPKFGSKWLSRRRIIHVSLGRAASVHAAALDGLSERLLASHYESNYGGALRRLNAIDKRLKDLDRAVASVFDVTALAPAREGNRCPRARPAGPAVAGGHVRGCCARALHNHLLRSKPATMYMHVGGLSDAVKLATALREGLSASKTPMGAPAAVQPTHIDLDTAALDAAMGHKGKTNGAIYQFSIPRAQPVKEGGMVLPEAMGSAIAINFQPTGGGKAAITGDFVLAADEVNSTLRALRANGIEVTALHSHMLQEEPRMFFMHFWAIDDAQKLAKGLGEALRRVKVTKAADQ